MSKGNEKVCEKKVSHSSKRISTNVTLNVLCYCYTYDVLDFALT